MKRILAALAIVLAALAFVPSAHADAPIRQDLPADTMTLEGICDFDVLLEFPTNKEKIVTFVDKEGNERFSVITGALTARLTNLDTGESITLNIPGPGRIEPQANGLIRVTYLGAALVWFPPNDSDLPPLAFVHGTVVTEFDDADTFNVLEVRGHVENVCAMLATP